MTALQFDRDEARRIAIRAQRLDADRPTDLLELVRYLTFLQLDPTRSTCRRRSSVTAPCSSTKGRMTQ